MPTDTATNQDTTLLFDHQDERVALRGTAQLPDGTHREIRFITVYEGPKGSFDFPTPHGAALHLNAAWKGARRASELRTAIRIQAHTESPGKTRRSVAESSMSALFDFFEEMMAVAFASYAAVEAFCNVTLVEQSNGLLEVVDRKRRRELWPVEKVERSISTKDKLGKLVPDLLGLPTPSGKKVWEGFVTLEQMRDEVVHFKRGSQTPRAGQHAVPTVLQKFYDLDSPYLLPEHALGVIRYFYPDPNMRPHWLLNRHWVRPDSALNPV
jgi:hypothetical protein